MIVYYAHFVLYFAVQLLFSVNAKIQDQSWLCLYDQRVFVNYIRCYESFGCHEDNQVISEFHLLNISELNQEENQRIISNFVMTHYQHNQKLLRRILLDYSRNDHLFWCTNQLCSDAPTFQSSPLVLVSFLYLLLVLL